jgi:hypothetical protein
MNLAAQATVETSPRDAERLLYRHLVDEVLRGVIDGDEQVMSDIRRFGGSLRFVNGQFQFTLPALFEFASERCKERGLQAAAQADYRAFRRTLYDNPTNAELRRHGGMVEVAQPDPEHAVTLYRLVSA